MAFVTNDPVTTVGSTTATGGVAWVNADRVVAADGVATTASQSSPSWTSDPLTISHCSMGLPSGATVTGLGVSISRKSNAGFITDSSVRISLHDGTTSTDLAGSGAWPTGFAAATYGGPTDLCGFSPTDLTAANVNGTGFAVSLVAQSSGGFDAASVDDMTVTVYYGGGGSVPAAAPFLLAHL